MKKFFGSVVCMLICVSMVFALCGCEAAEQREAAVREAADGYLSAVCELDFIGAADFTVEGESALEGSTVKNVDDLREQFSQIIVTSAGEQFAKYKEKFAPLSDAVIKTMKDKLSYEIIAVEEEGEKYAVSVKLTSMTADADFAALLGLDDVAATEMATNILKSLVESGKITEKTTEQELMDLMIDPLVAEILKRFEAGAENIGTESGEFRLIAEKTDGAWKINDSESDIALSEFVEQE